MYGLYACYRTTCAEVTIHAPKAEGMAREMPERVSQLEMQGLPSLPSSQIFELAKQGDFRQLREAALKDPKLWEITDEDGASLLHWGALFGEESFVSLGLEAGVSPNVVSLNGQTAMSWASIRGYPRVIRQLLEASANPCLADSLGASPLLVA
ncbi:unnamed protein product, partial [Polarella glacialis]